jgi:bacterioferritin-associated ferredoxin
MIDDMTSFDRELFHSAVALFYLRVQEVHNRTGVDVLCGNREAIKRLLRKEEKSS